MTAIKETRLSEIRAVPEVAVHPSDLIEEHLGRLLEEGEGTDLTVEVQGESISHRTGRCSRRGHLSSRLSSMGR